MADSVPLGGVQGGTLDRLGSAGVAAWLTSAVHGLEEHQVEIDDLNVYPVPDGDTGTNMLHTMRGAFSALDGRLAPARSNSATDNPAASGDDEDPSGADEAGSDVADTMREAARGSLLEARGNSGVILSQVIRGFSEAADAHGPLDPTGIADALRRSTDRAYEAVAKPVEGTILTVARAAAEGAESALGAAQDGRDASGETLSGVVRRAVESATEALERTPAMLPALARAGVVDAGGRGLEVVLLALQAVVEGRPVAVERLQRAPRGREVLVASREEGSSEFEYEVMYLLHSDDERVAQLRAELARLGDSVAIVGTGDGLFSVHVHVNDIGAAVECGLDAGRPHRVTVTRFAEQIAEGDAAAADDPAGPRPGRAVVAVALGEGIEDVFRSEGVEVVSGGVTFNPSTNDLLDAIRRTGVDHVTVLPNDGNVVGVARASARLAQDEGIQVTVIPSRSTVQGLAALVVRNPDRPYDAEAADMAAAVEGCAWGEVTVAVRAADTDAGEVSEGDVLGLVQGKIRVIGSDLQGVAATVLAQIVDDDSEFVSILLGEDADEGLGQAIEGHIQVRWPDVEVQVSRGGQPHYPLVIGVE